MSINQPTTVRRAVLPSLGGFGLGSLLIFVAALISLLILLGALHDDNDKLEWVCLLLIAVGVLIP